MLDRDNNHNGSCQFASELVDYVYGEIDGLKRDTFDAHLPACESCTSELAGISAARLSVMEWRSAEFDPLPTPSIEIPYELPREAGDGWLATIQGFFSSSPGWAAAAAIVPISVVCLGIALFTFDLFGPVEVARQDNSASNTPASDRKSNADVKVTNLDTPPEVTDSNPKQDNDVVDESVKEPTRSVKVSEKSVPRMRKVKTASIDTPAKTDRSDPPSTRQRSPRLNNFEDEEDDSLRMADLFAQTDTED
jgi:hypothetical protein